MAFYPNFIILVPPGGSSGDLRYLVFNENTEEFVEKDSTIGTNDTINFAAEVGEVVRVGIFHTHNATQSNDFYQISSNTPITITRGGLLKSDFATTISLTNPTSGNKTTTTSLSNYVATTGGATSDDFQHSFYFTVPSGLTTVTIKTNDSTSSSTLTINFSTFTDDSYGFQVRNGANAIVLDSSTKVTNVIQTGTLTINHNTPTNIANSNITTTNSDEFNIFVTGPFTATFATFIEGMTTTRYNGGFTVEYETPGGGTTQTFTFTYYIVRF